MPMLTHHTINNSPYLLSRVKVIRLVRKYSHPILLVFCQRHFKRDSHSFLSLSSAKDKKLQKKKISKGLKQIIVQEKALGIPAETVQCNVNLHSS